MPKTNKKIPTPKKKNTSADFFAMVEHGDSPENEAKRFGRYVKGPSKKELVSDSLSELYQDDNGERVNVGEVSIKRRRSWWMRLGMIALYLGAVAAVIAAGFYWYSHHRRQQSPVSLGITTESTVIANQEFTYTINYQNQDNVPLHTVELTAVYPENFIITDSFPKVSEGNNKWRLPDIKGFGSGQVQIRGKLIGMTGQSNMLFVDLSYQPESLTTSFKKTASLDTILASSGLDVMATSPGSLLVGEEKSLPVSWLLQEKNFLNTFNFRVETSNQLSVKGPKQLPAGITEKGGIWTIDPAKATEGLNLTLKALDKGSEKEEVKLLFEYTPAESEKAFVIEEKIFEIEVIKNSLNLSLSANGQTADQGVDFDQVINYSISYANKGEATMNNVIITAVLDSDALDWRKLEDKYNGKVVGSSIIWTPAEIPALAALAQDQQGTINFSIPVRSSNEAKLIERYEIKSYSQFSLTDKEEETSAEENESNRSNQLILKLNSDLNLDEAVRYFDEDNIAVGTGPLPPKVGERTTLKVYWNITNSLHELGNLSVSTTLPSGVTWDGKDIVSVGSLSYDAVTNRVTWNVGRLPLSAPEIKAEFSIALTPRLADQNRLMILASGTTVNAQDNQTTYQINKVLKAQTTKLEKDDIADTDGIVR